MIKDKLRIKLPFLKKFDAAVVTCLKDWSTPIIHHKCCWDLTRHTKSRRHKSAEVRAFISEFQSYFVSLRLQVDITHGASESESAAWHFGKHELSFRPNDCLKLPVLFPGFLVQVLKVTWRLLACWFHWQSFTFLSRRMTLVLYSQLENIEIFVPKKPLHFNLTLSGF